MFSNEVLNELINRKRENKLAHAYLIETNNIDAALDDLKKLIKKINCPTEYQDTCNTCNLCNLIDKNNLPSLKIIEPDGTSIKKHQIEELKMDFGTIPVYSKYNIYIIKNADKLNPSSANSMLKFVEEPTEGIIGFFLTTNKDTMMDTIKSRCQSIILNYNTTNLLESLNLSAEKFAIYKELIPCYLDKLADSEFINNKKEVLSILPERKEVETFIILIFNIYYNYYLKNIGADFNEEIIKIYNIEESLSTIKKKLQIITTILNEMSYNVNIELILDKFVIEMRGNHE